MKKILALLLAAVMVFALCACGSSSAPAATAAPAAPAADAGFGPKDGGSKLTFTTGGEAGTYFAFGGVMSQKVSEVTSTSVTAITSGGSKANIEALEMGDAQLGFTQSDVMSYGYTGARLFAETGAVTTFSTVASLYMEQVQIVTLNPDIKSVADLAGKAVSIGAAGSGVYFNAIDILGVYGLTEDDIKPTYQSFGDSAEALQDGQIDAAFIVAGAPTNAVTSLATTKDVYLVSLDDEHIDALIASSPYYSKNIIPAAAYGLDDDVTTVAVGAVVIAADDVSDADVYNFLYGVFENLDNLAHDKANELSLEFASSVTDVPYHPGAAAYFADKGITVPTK
ncbi:MAG: TAXI family TRAP transporter solute-binding subunit [Oscillospiraceae bacterium]|nr:TAXI family TRAP transporter solute-binding subunit [Oscillospiraceae bacterium]